MTDTHHTFPSAEYENDCIQFGCMLFGIKVKSDIWQAILLFIMQNRYKISDIRVLYEISYINKISNVIYKISDMLYKISYILH